MRNFTLGRKGIPIFLFALLLFSATFASYGQCPTVDAQDATQYFCDSQQAEIGDLEVSNLPTGTTLNWYSDQSSTNAIASTMFLIDGTTYYAGTDGSCAGSREEVTVSIASEPEILGIKSSSAIPPSARKKSLAVIGICVADINSPDLTVGDLRTNAADEDQVNWYYNRTDTTPIPKTTELKNNTDYYASIVSEDGGCETNRSKTTVRLFSEPAPTGPANQQFCAVNNPTLGDLEISGSNIRFFSTESSKTELSPNTPLVDGKTYYASSIGENCESLERLAVAVTVNDDIISPEPGIVCETDVQATFPSIDEIRKYYLSLLAPEIPRTGTLNPSASQLADMYQADADGLGDFTTTYTFGTGTCDQVDLTATIVAAEPATTGTINSFSTCAATAPYDLNDELSTATPGGTFTYTNSGDVISDGMLDISSEGPIDITYTVSQDDMETCLTGTASTEFTVTVGNSDALPEGPFTFDLCEAEVQNFLTNPSAAIDFFGKVIPEDLDQTGTFDPSLESIAASWIENPIGTFTSKYTVGEPGCQDSVNIVINVTEGTSYGTQEPGIVCETDVQATFPSIDEIRKYYLSLLAPEIPRTGTLNPSASQLADMYQADADGLGDFTTTYTFGTGTCDQVDLTATIVAAEPATTGTINSFSTCAATALYDLNDELSTATPGGTFTYTNSGDVISDGMLDISSEGPIDITYTVSQDDMETCLTGTASTEFTVTVGNSDALPEGPFTFDLCEAEVQNFLTNPSAAIDFFGKVIPEDLDQTGTFDPSLESIAASWIENPIGTFTSKYTVGEPGCQDSVNIVINVTEGTSYGTQEPGIICETDVQATFPSIDEIRKYYLSLLAPEIPRTGTLNPSASQLADMYQADADGLGDFTTTYTFGTGTCDQVDLTATIVAAEPATTGTINSFSTCAATAPYDLNDELSTATPGGTFTYTNSGDVISDGMLDISSEGPIDITYTVSQDDMETCLTGTASTEFTVTVTPNLDAGQPNSDEVCNFTVKNLSETGVRNLYLGLLDSGVPTDGTFNPSIQQLIEKYNIQGNIGDFPTTYTIGEGDCTASVDLIITVLENPNAGENGTLNFTIDETDSKDLISGLNGTPEDGGVWTFEGNEVGDSFDPTTDTPGAYTYTVTNANGCSASAIVTVTVEQDSTNCPEVTDTTPTLCAGSTVAELMPQDAAWYASADATDALTTDTALTDGGEYFAGDAAGECNARVMVTVTLVDAPIAPTVTAYSACAITGATVADLGDNITGDDDATFNVYTDADMNDMLDDTEVLVNGTYYVTQTSAAGCESAAAMLEVTLTDTDAPTLVQGGNVFCEFDGATIAELEEKITAGGDLTWYTTATGDETYTTAEVLENGVTYYVSSTPTGDCESSTRLAVTITLKTCEIVIPEIFSPNGDKINDEFVIENLASEYPNYKLEIYNRWGEPVYKGNASTPNWDGTSTEGSFGSGVLPAGVYFYILYYNDGTTPPTQGRLYLSR